MLNPRIKLLFKNLPDKYPHLLEQNYIHILNRLMQLWALPEFDTFMHDLLIDKRGGRQGFPPEVLAELLFMNELHNIFQQKGYHLPEVADPWKAVPVKDPSPRGFRHAIERGQLQDMEAFLGAGVTIDYRFESDQTPLIVACISGQLEAAICLIEDGAGVNARDRGKYTALHWAAFYGRTAVVTELIHAGALLDVQQNTGDTPLALAVMRGHLNSAEILLHHGANPDMRGDHGTPMEIARSKGNAQMTALLAGAALRA